MFNIKVKEIHETTHTNDGSFLQTPFWCEFKSRHGWNYKRFELEIEIPPFESDVESCEKNTTAEVHQATSSIKNCEVSVLSRSFCKGIFSLSYIPLFPELPYECTPEEDFEGALESKENSVITKEIMTPEIQTIEFTHYMSDIAKALKPYLPKNTIFIRFDPNVSFSDVDFRDMFNYGIKTISFADRLKLKKSKVDIQPPDTTLIDLTCSEDEILSKMHAKWRYNIRLSEKKGVKINKYAIKSLNLYEKLDKFYELTKETNARDGNSSHAKSYYKDLLESSINELSNDKDIPQIALYIAEHEGEEIASIMTLFSKDEAIYLYGASSNQKRNLMPNHLLQWTAMKDAKAYGSKVYDMYGMPPEGKDESHPMHGLYMFKANFGGKIIHRIGSWDYPTSVLYVGYNFVEKLRAFWFKKVVKKLKGR